MKLDRIIQLIRFLVLFFLLSQGIRLNAQQDGRSKFLVVFKDKSSGYFNHQEYFDKYAIERRIKHKLPSYDYTDLPVNENYINEIIRLSDSVKMVSRWFNAVVCYANETSIVKIEQLPFVSKIELLNRTGRIAIDDPGISFKKLSSDQKKLLSYQTSRMGSEEFSKNNIDGSGVRIAIFDAGFPGADRNSAFDHINSRGRIIKTYDFVKKKENVFEHNTHGTMVLSCIAGMVDSFNIGMATGSEFLLARTENAKVEPFSEEENWLAAAEWADKNGADIINSSLGYTFHRYFSNQMDGKTSLVARAANIAASKGILVINSAGNEGSANWHCVGTPADADSVLSVGAINPSTNLHTSFSSFGPTADKRLKPNVSSVGHVIAAQEIGFNSTQGTSFSSPLTAGFAACAMQLNKSLTNMELFREIEKSADLYPYFDYAHGYGVPQAAYFFEKELKNIEPTFDLVKENDFLFLIIRDQYLPVSNVSKNKFEVINPYQIRTFSKADYFYYHLENEKKILDNYYVLEVAEKIVLKLSLADYKKGQTLRFHYKKYTLSYAI